MILQSLTECYEQLVKQGKVGSDGWCTAKVSYAITIDSAGNLKNIVNIQKEAVRGSKKVLVPVEQTVPLQKGRSSKIAPNFLCDNAKYLLGAWIETADQEENERNRQKAESYFLASAKYHQEILSRIDDEFAKSVCNFFENWNFERDKEKINVDLNGLLAASNLVFRSFETGRGILEENGIKAVWNDTYAQSGSKDVGVCIVTGKTAPIARLHPLVKGVRGAQSSGAALVSFNAPAFESYGKSQGANAAVSEYVANAYGKALNYLLDNQKHHRLIGDTTVVFWSETGKEEYADVIAQMLGDGEESAEDKLLQVMDAVKKGKKCVFESTELLPDTQFYILGLSPNAARVSIRFFYKNTFGSLIKNINAHYQRLQIVRPEFVSRQYPSIVNILYETVNRNSSNKQIQPVLSGKFTSAVLNDSRYPAVIFSHLMIRIRADKNVNCNRAAMLKAYIMKNYPLQGEVVGQMELNEATDNVPYTLGRIFAVLEYVQDKASSSLNTTIKDRYFNSACTTPAIIFPRLLKLKNNHMRILARDNKGMQVKLEKQLGDLLAKLHEEIPKYLTLEEQGIFIIGYYHQIQKRYTKNSESISEEQED